MCVECLNLHQLIIYKSKNVKKKKIEVTSTICIAGGVLQTATAGCFIGWVWIYIFFNIIDWGRRLGNIEADHVPSIEFELLLK